MLTAQELLLGAGLLLPPGTNVFTYVQGVLHSQVDPSVPKSYQIQLYVLAGLFALKILLFAAAFVTRALKSRQPLFRLHATARGTYIVPHFTLAWQLFTIIGMGLIFGYIDACLCFARGDTCRKGQLWLQLPWLSLYLAAILALWSLTVASVLPSGNGEERNGKRFARPRFVNAFFLSLIVLVIGGIAAGAGAMTRHYEHFVTTYEAINTQLFEAASQFTSESTAQVQLQLAGLVEPLQACLDAVKPFDVSFRVSWSSWVLGTTVLFVLLSFIGSRYFAHLAHELKALERSTRDNSPSSPFDFNGSRSDSLRTEHIVHLRRAWIDMIVACFAIIIVSFLYMGVSLAAAILGSSGLHSPAAFQAMTLVALYPLAVIGVPCGLLALVRSVQHQPLRPAAPRTRGLSKNAYGSPAPPLYPDSPTPHPVSSEFHVSISTTPGNMGGAEPFPTYEMLARKDSAVMRGESTLTRESSHPSCSPSTAPSISKEGLM
ncbi:hypothetical protein JCM21900_004888 [Sporobolomyces salmonicolor]